MWLKCFTQKNMVMICIVLSKYSSLFKHCTSLSLILLCPICVRIIPSCIRIVTFLKLRLYFNCPANLPWLRGGSMKYRLFLNDVLIILVTPPH